MPVVGASGAISGLMGAGMRIFYGALERKPLAPLSSRAILGFSAIWIIGNAITGILRIGVADGVSLVAWVAGVPLDKNARRFRAREIRVNTLKFLDSSLGKQRRAAGGRLGYNLRHRSGSTGNEAPHI